MPRRFVEGENLVGRKTLAFRTPAPLWLNGFCLESLRAHRAAALLAEYLVDDDGD
jgi:hypothetical protein